MGRKYTQETRTKKSFGESVNIRAIAARAIRGQPVPMLDGVAMYGDFTGVRDLQDAMEKVDAARRFFSRLPPRCRREFKDDPLEFVELMESIQAGVPGARARGIGLGVVEPSEEERRYMRSIEIEQRRSELSSLEDALTPSVEEDEPVASG